MCDLRGAALVGVGQQNSKLFAAVPRGNITRPLHGFVDRLGDDREDTVTFRVAIGVVETLEAVDIDQEQR